MSQGRLVLRRLPWQKIASVPGELVVLCASFDSSWSLYPHAHHAGEAVDIAPAFEHQRGKGVAQLVHREREARVLVEGLDQPSQHFIGLVRRSPRAGRRIPGRSCLVGGALERTAPGSPRGTRTPARSDPSAPSRAAQNRSSLLRNPAKRKVAMIA
jgi:hypothetical protein